MIPRTETESAVELAFSFGPRPLVPDELIANETLSLPVIYVICGPAGSGKTTLAKKLEKNGCKRMITCTTREPRPGEVDGEDYIFVTPEEFRSQALSGQFAENQRYEIANKGPVWYGSYLRDYKDQTHDRVVVLDPFGVKAVRKLGIPNLHVIFLDTDLRVCRRRIELRGDDPAEIERRLAEDRKIFSAFRGSTLYDEWRIYPAYY